MGVTVTGAAAELRWGYASAATLGAWTVLKAEGQWTLTATVVRVNDFTVSQRPLTFVTPNGWRWPIGSLQLSGGALTATLGPKESDHASVSIRPT